MKLRSIMPQCIIFTCVHVCVSNMYVFHACMSVHTTQSQTMRLKTLVAVAPRRRNWENTGIQPVSIIGGK